MPTRKLSALLVDTASLSRLTRASQRITALQRLYVICAPPELTQASRVVYDRDGILIIAADNSTIASKLKQLTPRLLKQLRNRSFEITGIRVVIQVERHRHNTETVTKLALLPNDLIDEFDKLVQRVKDPSLRTALVRFANRRRG